MSVGKSAVQRMKPPEAVTGWTSIIDEGRQYEEMKKIKLFPSPHVEVTLFISDQMKQDMKECWRRAFESGKDCDTCSWRDVRPFGTGMCEQEEVIQKVLDKPGDMSRYIYSGNKRKHRVIKNGK